MDEHDIAVTISDVQTLRRDLIKAASKIADTFRKDPDEVKDDVKTAMTGGSVAVVGENCIDTLNFTANLKNSLCNKNYGAIQSNTETKKGFYHYNDGTYEDLSASSLNYYNKLFSVNGNSDYKVTGRASGENVALCVFFDKDKDYQCQNITYKEEIISVLALYFDKYYGINYNENKIFQKHYHNSKLIQIIIVQKKKCTIKYFY